MLDLRGGLGIERTFWGARVLHWNGAIPGRESILAFIAVFPPRAGGRRSASSVRPWTAMADLWPSEAFCASGSAVGCGCCLVVASAQPSE